jgi:hypothetical protein
MPVHNYLKIFFCFSWKKCYWMNKTFYFCLSKKNKNMIDEQLRYPTGKFKAPETVSSDDIKQWMDVIEKFPERLQKETATLNDAQLNTPYRDEGWTVRQVVHHVADSHMNAYIRFKLTLTEDTPTIKPYLEARWAEMPDSKATINLSLPILEGVHKRWMIILRSMKPEDFERKLFHPEQNKELFLKNMLALYAWHSNHHLAHITELKKREGWK